MIGKEGGGAEDSFGVTVVVTVDRCFFFGRESPAVVDFDFGCEVSPSGSQVVVWGKVSEAGVRVLDHEVCPACGG